MPRIAWRYRDTVPHDAGTANGIAIREYRDGDRHDVCRIHDAARLDELRDAAVFLPTDEERAAPWTGPIDGDAGVGRERVGREAFRALEQT